MGALCLALDKIATAFFTISLPIPLVIAINAFLAVCLYKPLDQLILRVFKVFVFPRDLRPLIRLLKVGRELAGILELNELGNIIVNTLVDCFRFDNATVFIRDTESGTFVVAAACGISLSEAKKIRFDGNCPLAEKLRIAHHPVMAQSALRHLAWREAASINHSLEDVKASAMLPLRLNGEFIGSIGLGRRLSGKSFSRVEQRVFMEFSSAVSQALHNAISFGDLRCMNEVLKDCQSRFVQKSRRLAVEHLASGIAHEIHNPLTVISGKAQVLLLNKDKPDFQEKAIEVLKTIVGQTQRAADVTKRLLMFTRSFGNDRYEDIDFDRIIRNTVALVSYQASVDSIEIEWHVDSSLPQITGRIRDFQEIFLNLILNSVQSIECNGRIDITVKQELATDAIEISVSDTGRGIRKEDIPQVFDPFFTKKEGRIGLGLFLAQQIVHQYEGTIKVESSIGSGSVLLIEFPLYHFRKLRETKEFSSKPKQAYPRLSSYQSQRFDGREAENKACQNF